MKLKHKGIVVVMSAGAAPTYLGKILKVQPSHIIACWPMNEISGTAIVDAKKRVPDGTYSNVTLNNALSFDGVGGCPLFDGSTSKADVFSAALAALFNTAEGSMFWAGKVANAGVLTDGAFRVGFNFRTDDQNEIYGRKSSVNNRLDHYRRANNAPVGYPDISFNSIDWVHWGVVWSIAGDYVKIIKNGAQIGTTQSGLAAWVGGAITTALIGARNTNAQVWSGWISHVIAYDIPLELTDWQTLADPNP